MSKFENKDAVIYCRVASIGEDCRDQRLHAQEQRCRDYAQQNGYDVAQVFSDHASGNSVDRPGIQALLTFLRSHRSDEVVVLIDDVSRLARSMTTYMTLRRMIDGAGGKLESPSLQLDESPDNSLIEGLLVAVAEYEENKARTSEKRT